MITDEEGNTTEEEGSFGQFVDELRKADSQFEARTPMELVREEAERQRRGEFHSRWLRKPKVEELGVTEVAGAALNWADMFRELGGLISDLLGGKRSRKGSQSKRSKR